MKNNNVLYKDIAINFNIIDTWEKEFVSTRISNKVLQCDKDIQEKEDYITDLKTKNFENDLNHTVNSAGINDSDLLGNCLYTDVDNT